MVCAGSMTICAGNMTTSAMNVTDSVMFIAEVVINPALFARRTRNAHTSRTYSTRYSACGTNDSKMQRSNRSAHASYSSWLRTVHATGIAPIERVRRTCGIAPPCQS